MCTIVEIDSSSSSPIAAPTSGIRRAEGSRRRRHHRLQVVGGRQVFLFVQDFDRLWRLAVGQRTLKILQDHGLGDARRSAGRRLNDLGGARIQEGVRSLAGCAEIFHPRLRSGSVVPHAIARPCAGGAVYSPAMTDFIAMVDRSSYVITGSTWSKPSPTKSQRKISATYARTAGRSRRRTPALSRRKAGCEMRDFCPICRKTNAEDPPVVASTDPADREDAALDSLVPTEATLRTTSETDPSHRRLGTSLKSSPKPR